MSDTPQDRAGDDPLDLSAMLSQFLGETAQNPELAEALRGMGIDPSDPATLATLTTQIRSLTDPSSGPDPAELATSTARAIVATGDADPSIGDPARRVVTDAVAVAQLWIDPVTTLPAAPGVGRAWSRAEWVDATMPRWQQVVAPVATGVTRAMTTAMRSQLERLGEISPEELSDLGLPGLTGLPGIGGGEGAEPVDLRAVVERMRPMMERMSTQMFAAQTGQAVGALAEDLVSGTEVGLPLTDDGDIALLPTNIAALAAGLDLDVAELRLYLAVREAARARLFAGAPWLGPALMAAVEDYARNISIDTDAIEARLASIDLQDPGALQEALQGNLFAPAPTPQQRQALERLETVLALVEGWVDVVTDRATAAHLPHTAPLGEAIRRRRAGGPAERTFNALVGLDLRARRLRDAANLWAALEADGGIEARDGRWAHPDLAPTASDLDDPLGYVERIRATSDTDLDEALDALLRGELGGDAPTDGE